MAQAEQETTQCRALTDDGERCSRPATDDGFCYQHDDDDPTVDETEGDDEPSDGGGDADGAEERQTGDSDMSTDTDEANDSGEQAEIGSEIDLWQVRETAERVAEEFIDDPFDGVIEIERTEDEEGENDEWRVVVEVIERNSVPDTQDILGRYAITIDPSGDVKGYRLTGRYRRGDVSDEQTPEQ